MASQGLIEIEGKKVLIAGDICSGKTAYTAKVVEKILKQNKEEEITILDFAPEHGKIGASLRQYLKLNLKNYFAPEKVEAPRLEGGSGEEVVMLAEKNARSMAPLLKRYLERPTKYLIINDVSLYLQAGDYELLRNCIKKAETAVINSYYGRSLSDDKGSNISAIERRNVETLMKDVDLVIRF